MVFRMIYIPMSRSVWVHDHIFFQSYLAHLYEITGSYCYHPVVDIGVGVGVGVTL